LQEGKRKKGEISHPLVNQGRVEQVAHQVWGDEEVKRGLEQQIEKQREEGRSERGGGQFNVNRKRVSETI